VHFVWDEVDSTSKGHSAHYRRFDGTSWQAPVVLDPDGGGGPLGTYPCIAAAQQQLHIVWRGKDVTSDAPAGARLRAVFSSNSGVTLSPPRFVDQGSGHAINFLRLSGQPTHAFLLWDSDLETSPALLVQRLVVRP
jgi:hypothetical protein